MFNRSLIAALCAASLVSLLPASAVAHNQLVVDAGRGPVTVYLPDSYQPGQPLPLILLLHGFGSQGAIVESWLSLLSVIDEKQFIYAHPDGTVDSTGAQFWNATNACCNLFGSTVDDSQYLSDLIDQIELNLDVDPLRVHIAGHSNGGFMSYRMACDHSGRIASIASLAGASWNEPSLCAPASPVHVLQVHGTLDATIKFNGGLFFGMLYPSAQDSVEQWAAFDGCSSTGVPQPPTLDYVASVPGAETSVTTYAAGCLFGGSGELWAMQDAPHVPSFTPAFTPDLVDWLLAHPKSSAPLTYCTAGTSAGGCAASLSSTGTASVSTASGFLVAAHSVEGTRDGLFFYGFAGPQAAPWGNSSSFQCVTPPVSRAPVMQGRGSPGECNGSFLQDFNTYWASAPAPAVPAPGSMLWLQLWYRDPLSTSNQSTALSDALAVAVGL